MQAEDENPLAEKILSDIISALTKYSEICEFEIIPNEINQNKSPVIRAGTTLGLESWCIKHTYLYVHNRLINMRQKRSKLRVKDVKMLDRMLIGALLLNGDVSTYWNMRRELVINENVEIHDELRISRLVLSNKPKCNEAFLYRKWLLSRFLKTQSNQNDLSNLIRQENEVALRAAERYRNNYHAWNYKLWVNTSLMQSVSTYYETFIYHELEHSEINITKSVSDYSTFQYRQQIIKLFKKIDVELDEKYLNKFLMFFKHNIVCQDLDKTNWIESIILVLGKPPKQKSNPNSMKRVFNLLKILLYDLLLVSELNTIYSCHESIWYHRRFVLFHLFELLYEYYDIKQQKLVNFDQILNDQCMRSDDKPTASNIVKVDLITKHKWLSNIVQSVLLYKAIEENERKELECCNRDVDQSEYVINHKKWLYLFLGLKNLEQ